MDVLYASNGSILIVTIQDLKSMEKYSMIIYKRNIKKLDKILNLELFNIYS